MRLLRQGTEELGGGGRGSGGKILFIAMVSPSSGRHLTTSAQGGGGLSFGLRKR